MQNPSQFACIPRVLTKTLNHNPFMRSLCVTSFPRNRAQTRPECENQPHFLLFHIEPRIPPILKAAISVSGFKGLGFIALGGSPT